MPAIISAGDRGWCGAAASSLLAGSSVRGGPSYPGIEPRLNKWTALSGLLPEESISGSIVPGATSFTVAMPPPAQLTAYFVRTVDAKARLEAFLEAAILHELVHFRQTGAIATSLLKAPSAANYLGYYLNPAELEAHGAQIAYGLRSKSLPIGVDEVFETAVGRRIRQRLHSLSWSLSSGADYARFRHDLAAEVNHCIALLG